MSLLFNLYQEPTGFFAGIVVVSLWSLVWKGFGLWHSARNKQKRWYVAMLVLNTAGLLPIIYLIWFKPKKVVREETIKKLVRKQPIKKSKKK